MTTKPPLHEKAHLKRLNRFWAVAAVLGAAAFLALVGMRLFQNKGQALSVGEPPQEFVLETFSGERISTAELRGNVVLVNFWASWCTTCARDADLLEQAWQHYQVESPEPVHFLGVAYMDTQANAEAFLSTHGITFPSGPDLRGEISRIYQVKAVPETFILDQAGVLRYVKFGPFSSLTEIVAAVDAVLLLDLD